jgi:hypothetical protein
MTEALGIIGYTLCIKGPFLWKLGRTLETPSFRLEAGHRRTTSAYESHSLIPELLYDGRQLTVRGPKVEPCMAHGMAADSSI